MNVQWTRIQRGKNYSFHFFCWLPLWPLPWYKTPEGRENCFKFLITLNCKFRWCEETLQFLRALRHSLTSVTIRDLYWQGVQIKYLSIRWMGLKKQVSVYLSCDLQTVLRESMISLVCMGQVIRSIPCLILFTFVTIIQIGVMGWLNW